MAEGSTLEEVGLKCLFVFSAGDCLLSPVPTTELPDADWHHWDMEFLYDCSVLGL